MVMKNYCKFCFASSFTLCRNTDKLGNDYGALRACRCVRVVLKQARLQGRKDLEVPIPGTLCYFKVASN